MTLSSPVCLCYLKSGLHTAPIKSIFSVPGTDMALLLDCPLCLLLMTEPVTMSCGHSFCRRCVVGCYLPSKCPVCRVKLRQKEVRATRNNVLLISVVEKCCPEESRLRSHVQDKLRTSEFTEALRITTEGLHTGKKTGAPSHCGDVHLHLCNSHG